MVTFPQGARTKGSLDVELTMSFKIRPAGWANNDSMSASKVWSIARLFQAVVTKAWILYGDEKLVSTKVRWKRPSEKRYRLLEDK